MAEITDSGYLIKTQNEWFEEERDRYILIDPKWNLDPSTPDGMKLATDSEIWANLDELGQRAYNSKDPAKASGYDLRVLSSITGTTPSDGSPSDVELTANGIDGAVITAGSLVENVVNGSQWSIIADATISAGVATLQAQSVDQGSIQAGVGDISKILTPISGWQSVTNAAVATPGSNPDTDAELRARRTLQVALPGSNQVDSLYAAVSAVDDVRRVVIYENEENVDVNEGSLILPPHSTTTIVDGGEDQSIGEAMYTKKNPGCKQNQAANPVDVPVVSPVTGNTKTMKFSRPDYVDITVVASITNDGSLPNNADDLIKDAILGYVGGDLLGSTIGFNQTGFDIGEDVNSSRLYTPVNFVIGSYGNSFISGILVNGAASVPIDAGQLARFTEANITVNITP